MLEWEPAADAPDDLTFLLVHGFTDLAHGWDEVAARLVPHGHVLAPDMRGHGDSDWVGAGGYYYFPDYVADLDDVIARMARRRLVVVGHSMGGGVCSSWAGTRPARLAALALLEGLGPPDASDGDPGLRMANWIDSWGAARAHRRVLASIDDAIARLRKHDPLLTEAAARHQAVAGTRPLADGTPGLTWKHDPLHLTVGPNPYRLDVARRLWRKIQCPVLVVDGERSRLNLPAAERAARRAELPNHRHVVVPDAGHALQRHQPAAVAQLIIDLAASA